MAKQHFLGTISPGNLKNRGLDQKVLEFKNPPKSEVLKSKSLTYDFQIGLGLRLRFPGLIMPKKCYFAICSSKTEAWIKKFQKYNPPQGFYGQIWFWGQKSFQEPPKIKKNNFLKELNSVICPNMGGGRGSDPSHPNGVGLLGVICQTPFLLQAPVSLYSSQPQLITTFKTFCIFFK